MAEKLIYGNIGTKKALTWEDEYGAHNYHPIPVVIARGKGPYVWDPEGKKYFDFLSAYSALNQGHCHPKIIETLVNQAKNLTLTSRAFYNNKLGEFEKYITEVFGYEMVLPMNTGAEAVETAMKLSRKWGYEKKGIAPNRARLVFCENNFHGRTIGTISASDDPSRIKNFGPFLSGIDIIPYNDVKALKKLLNEKGNEIAAFIIEPIQGEAGVIVPDKGYLKKCYELCHKYDVLFVADEIQTGIGRTGRMLASDWEGIHPDIVTLGKALSGGVLPVSAVLSSKEIMMVIRPGEHGSTFGGNPLASAVAKTSLQVVMENDLPQKAEKLGQIFRNEMKRINSPLIKDIRGKGLLNAVVIEPSDGFKAWDVCVQLKEFGLLAKPTHQHIIRFTPPLIISELQIMKGLQIIKDTFNLLNNRLAKERKRNNAKII